ncbi:MAG: hypothetical protein ACTHUY_00765 [Flaviflexus sp.]|uniref:hypothetical protein n=1 Tax=Flaviflexus sp. TaxID=1969482 RepID=UPI003F9314A1
MIGKSKKQHEPGHVPTAGELYRAIAARTAIGYLILAILGGAIGYGVDGTPGLWGALLGVSIAGTAMGLTLAVMILTEKRPGINDMSVLLGGYLLKIAILFVVFVSLQRFDFFNETALLLGFVGAVVVSLAVDTITIARTRA